MPLGSSVREIRALAGGYSDSRVVLCDIGREPNVRSDDVAGPSGQFIVKVGLSSGHPQSAAHYAFTRALPEFAAVHVPELILAVQGSGVSADVYDIAGFSLDSLRSAEHVTDYADREEACIRVASDLLRAQLAAAGQPDYSATGASVLREWLGAKFPDDQRGSRVREIQREISRSPRVFRHEGELLLHPLALFGIEHGPYDESVPCFRGQAHGDLHLRNIMVRGSLQTRDLAYWLIDVSSDDPVPLLYDHAYLELAAFLYELSRSGSGKVLSLLARMDDQPLTIPVELSLSDIGIVQLVSHIRNATLRTLRQLEPRREDVWQRQFLFARIAAGLNWAAKPLDDPTLRRAALLSASWAARLLVRTYHRQLWIDLAQEDHGAGEASAAGATRIAPSDALRRWVPFQSRIGTADLFLLADEISADETLAALGACRWAAVIDLDPHSDSTGLSSVVTPVLTELRHVSVFGENAQVTSPEAATNWLMANGWASRREATTESDDAWKRGGYLTRVRQLVDRVHDDTSRTGAAVLCLRSGKRDRQLDRVLDYIDERYGGIQARLDLALAPAVNGLDLTWFLGMVEQSRPATGTLVPCLPKLDGQWPLKRADLHRLSVDLEVLHTEILSQDQTGVLPTDEFWRGRPPTWGELEAWLDVQRDAYPSLLKDVSGRLEDHQLAIVHLPHSPGAGGTTLARRVAWSLHRRFPTVLLRTYSVGTIERVDEIYQETGLAVLVIAESADLPESDRDELQQGLLQRNSRAVILWVNRTTVRRGTKSARHKHGLIDPLTDGERDRFLKEYRNRAETDRARDLLDELAGETGTVVPPQKLSPFYFGLCVYDEDFVGVADYVRNHLRQLTPVQRPVARFLALITRYGQQLGLPVHFVQNLMGTGRPSFEGLSDDQLSELLGPDLRHLVVEENNSLRLLHPLIADEVLSADMGGAKFSLGQIAVELIKRVANYFGPNSGTTDRLLNELFIRRNWSEDRRGQGTFSDLIIAMSTSEAEYVFDVLTASCPDNPHFWNHRGRYHIYQVRGDFARAEQYLLTAVEKSHGRDGIHLHTLGMVRRFWIEDELTKIARRQTPVTPEEALAEIEPMFITAMRAFEDAGRFHQTDHTWATPIQLIAYVVDRLVSLSRERNLADFMERHGEAANWVTKQIALAESMLDNLRNTDELSPYYQRLTNQLDALYGDLERLVERWKELRHHGGDDAEISRALARTLFAQGGRDWTELTEDQLRDIAEMAGEAVREGRASDSDLRLWFQSYRRLPEYSETYALERFSWSADQQSLEANYYLYVLNYLIWDRGDARSTDRVKYYLEECRRLGRLQRRQWSFEWLGVEGRPHPLVHFTELGTQRHGRTGFWSRPHQLRRVAGIIQEIEGPQSGRVKILDTELTAFFAPRNQFRQTRDINAAIEFYLGFSYEGLRAWEPTYPGEVPDALRLAEKPRGPHLPTAKHDPQTRPPQPQSPDPSGAAHRDDTSEDLPTPATPTKRRIRPTAPMTLRTRPSGTAEDYKAVILAMLEDADRNGQSLRSLEVGEVLQAQFGPDSYALFRKEGLRKAIERLGFRTVITQAGFDVALH
jgi:hypothetical protein